MEINQIPSELLSQIPLKYIKNEKSKRAEELHREWVMKHNSDEMNLSATIGEYEEKYFDDMRFAEGSIVAPYMEEEIEYQKGKFGKQWYSIPYELEPATLMESNYYRFLIGDPGDGAAGCFCGDDYCVTFDKNFANDVHTILHEMIHVHEHMLEQAPTYFREILFIRLYQVMKEKIPNLDELLIDHTHMEYGEEITRQGGKHGILFYLKSLDLDLRCNEKLGTICGYGRDMPVRER